MCMTICSLIQRVYFYFGYKILYLQYIGRKLVAIKYQPKFCARMQFLHKMLVFCDITMLLLRLFMWWNNVCDEIHILYHMAQIPGFYKQFFWQLHKRTSSYLMLVQTSVCFPRNCILDAFPRFGRESKVACPKIAFPLPFQNVDIQVIFIYPVQQGNSTIM